MRIIADPQTRSAVLDKLGVMDGKVEPLFVVRGTDEHFKAVVDFYLKTVATQFGDAQLQALHELKREAGLWPSHTADGKVERIDMAADRPAANPADTLEGILIGKAIRELEALGCKDADFLHKLRSTLKAIPLAAEPGPATKAHLESLKDKPPKAAAGKRK